MGKHSIPRLLTTPRHQVRAGRVGPIGACRCSAYMPHAAPHSVPSGHCGAIVGFRSAFAESDGKPRRYPKLDRAGCGRLKDVSRKAFEAARQTKTDNSFKRAYHEALARTHDETHARFLRAT
ncbi:MAG: hypothetical protein H0W76_07960 [Pyrinomonadaceae bacterium]|nr:hypothetical protein [Pyrinomonadaceae bacterium]